MFVKQCSALGMIMVVTLGSGADANPSARRGSVVAKHGAPQRNARRPHDSGTCTGAGANAFLGAGQSNNAYGLDTGVVAGSFNIACDDYSVVVGGSGNNISSAGLDNALYSFIGAGQSNLIYAQGSAIGAGTNNEINAEYGAIGSGTDNLVNGYQGFVGSGFRNQIQLSQNAVISGGSQNTISAQNNVTPSIAGGTYGVIGGGYTNTIVGPADQQGMYATIAGGVQNTVNANFATIGGGDDNNATAAGGFVGGGYANTAGGAEATVGGGVHNTASGIDAIVPGGYGNLAKGNTSFAAGYIAQALTTGSFVWSDQGSASVHVKSTVPNEFVARASGGVFFYSNPAMTSGVRLAAGSGTWSSLSDRHMKTGIVPIDGAQILDKVAALPVSEWSYTSERGVRHIGPMAQDFYAAFGVGEDDRHITTIDEDGVALTAVKALHAENASLRAQNSALLTRAAALQSGNAALTARMTAVEVGTAAMRRELAALEAEVGRRHAH